MKKIRYIAKLLSEELTSVVAEMALNLVWRGRDEY